MSWQSLAEIASFKAFQYRYLRVKGEGMGDSSAAASITLQKGANYHRLAELMDKGKDLAVFRRFDDLNIICLLSLQAEILGLENEYRDQCEHDGMHAGTDAAEYASHFKSASSRAQRARRSPPSVSCKAGCVTPRAGTTSHRGIEFDTWGDPDTRKYVAAGPPLPETDVYTHLLRDWLFDVFHFLFGERWRLGTEIDVESGMRSYNDSHVDRAVSIVTVILSSMIPVLTIFALNAVSTTEKRIGLVALFTGIFAAVLAVFSSARRVEIFAATAAFAAVEVVYVGTALGSYDG